jgi:hypothetical protein
MVPETTAVTFSTPYMSPQPCTMCEKTRHLHSCQINSSCHYHNNNNKLPYILPLQPSLMVNSHYWCCPSIMQNPSNNQIMLLQQCFPENPQSSQPIIWGTAMKGFFLLEFPTSSFLDWVAFLPGVWRLPPGEETIKFYCSNNKR